MRFLAPACRLLAAAAGRPPAQAAAWLALLALAARALPASAPCVAVIASRDAEPYAQALAGLQEELLPSPGGRELRFFQLGGDPARVAQTMAEVRRLAPAVVVTLGSLATDAAAAQLPGLPVVAGMVLRPEDLRGRPQATGVSLEVPAERPARLDPPPAAGGAGRRHPLQSGGQRGARRSGGPAGVAAGS